MPPEVGTFLGHCFPRPGGGGKAFKPFAGHRGKVSRFGTKQKGKHGKKNRLGDFETPVFPFRSRELVQCEARAYFWGYFPGAQTLRLNTVIFSFSLPSIHEPVFVHRLAETASFFSQGHRVRTLLYRLRGTPRCCTICVLRYSLVAPSTLLCT